MSSLATAAAVAKVFWQAPLLEGLPQGTEFVVPEDAGAHIVYLRTGNCITYASLLPVADALRTNDRRTAQDRTVELLHKLHELHLMAVEYNVWPGWRI